MHHSVRSKPAADHETVGRNIVFMRILFASGDMISDRCETDELFHVMSAICKPGGDRRKHFGDIFFCPVAAHHREVNLL
jgi:hypothetical protein